MRKAWRAFTTVFTVLGVAAIIAGAVVVKAGRISVEARADPSSKQTSDSMASGGTGSSPPAESPRELSEPDAKLWLRRLEKLRAELTEADRDLAARAAAFREEKEELRPLVEALSGLIGVMLPGTPPAPEELLARPATVTAVAEKLRAKTASVQRLPELLATIDEMTEEDAATLVSQGLSDDLALLLLASMNAERRASILGTLVRKNPIRAGEIFARLAGEPARPMDEDTEENGEG